VSPLVRFVAHGDTTVFDAYLSPPLADYIDRVTSAAAAVDALYGALVQESSTMP